MVFPRACSRCFSSFYKSEFEKFNSTKRQMLDSSKLKEFADDNFKFYKNGTKFSEMSRRHSVEKGEIALYEQFLLFPQCFQNTCTADT